jgi:AraC-like DNA-binding protein
MGPDRHGQPVEDIGGHGLPGIGAETGLRAQGYRKQDTRTDRHCQAIKAREAIELLLRHDPTLKDFLFDFSEPYKIDLEAFMNQNYMYNITSAQFARLTGRSLAGFKRDFQKTFKTSPSHWLLRKRLAEAYYQIREKGNKPVDVYLTVGFENLSHFSYTFKKEFGVAPSMV